MLSIFLLLVSSHQARAQTANPGQYQYVFTVAADGSGQFRHIQDAINAMRAYPLAPITLYIRNGIYREKILLPATHTDVRFIGESADSTIIIFNDYSGKGGLNTFTSYTAKISGNRFYAENISFVNDAGPVGQALALYVDADKAVFRNCRFIGNQDTIFAAGESSRQLFDDCYIEGTTDFIFGPATAVFRNCTILAKKDSYLTAASTPAGKPYGFVFIKCRIQAVAGVSRLFLGRPWRAYAKTVFLQCHLPAAIDPRGWDNWKNPENEKTVFYAEWKNTGEGADTSHRAPWSRQLNRKQADAYDLDRIFKIQPTGPSGKWFEHPAVNAYRWPPKSKSE